MYLSACSTIQLRLARHTGVVTHAAGSLASSLLDRAAVLTTATQ